MRTDHLGRQGRARRPFKVPLAPVTPLIGIALCLWLMIDLPGSTWLRFAVWMSLGLAIYALYGYRNSRLRHPERASIEA